MSSSELILAFFNLCHLRRYKFYLNYRGLLEGNRVYISKISNSANELLNLPDEIQGVPLFCPQIFRFRKERHKLRWLPSASGRVCHCQRKATGRKEEGLAEKGVMLLLSLCCRAQAFCGDGYSQ